MRNSFGRVIDSWGPTGFAGVLDHETAEKFAAHVARKVGESIARTVDHGAAGAGVLPPDLAISMHGY